MKAVEKAYGRVELGASFELKRYGLIVFMRGDLADVNLVDADAARRGKIPQACDPTIESCHVVERRRVVPEALLHVLQLSLQGRSGGGEVTGRRRVLGEFGLPRGVLGGLGEVGVDRAEIRQRRQREADRRADDVDDER